jgi:hypothetical protein
MSEHTYKLLERVVSSRTGSRLPFKTLFPRQPSMKRSSGVSMWLRPGAKLKTARLPTGT